MSSEYHTASEITHAYVELSSEEPSRPSSAGADNPPLKRGRVRFNSTSEANDSKNQKSKFPLRDRTNSPPTAVVTTPKPTKSSPAHSRNSSVTNLIRQPTNKATENPFADPSSSSPHKPRPSLLRNNSSVDGHQNIDDVEDFNEKTFSALAAQERAQRVASLVGSHSAPASRRNSLDENSLPTRPVRAGPYPVRVDDIPLADLDSRRTYGGDAMDSDDEAPSHLIEKAKTSGTTEAHMLVRAHTKKRLSDTWKTSTEPLPGLVSGQVTPTEEQHEDDYVPRPSQYRGGVLSSLLKLYNAPQGSHSRRGSDASPGSPSVGGTGSSGTNTPRSKHAKWYNQKNQSQDTLAGLIEASAILGAQGGGRTPTKKSRPGVGKRTHSGKLIETMKTMTRPRLEDEIRITVHIAETISRQKYLLKLCRALMSYGAPTHRLEEYMKMSARVLEIDGQFLYIPGCMIISFDDVSTHTTEVKLVKSAQGVDLGRLKDVHEVYKEVVHDVIGVEEATQNLDLIIRKKPRNHPWVLVGVYGLASAAVGPFAFQARMIDLPISFLLGALLGYLQLILAPKSETYSNVFEISAAVATSFLARAMGSIRGGDLFCFSALAQSSIALILPGYLVLCASLELQSRSMVAGSVRMVYAIMYSLFLGFGITVGITLYGLMDPNATSQTTCQNPISDYYKWIFVLLFTLCLCIINQAKWKQMPVMLFISGSGYAVNFAIGKKLPAGSPILNTFGAFTIGVLGNLYSRMRHGVAVAAMLPAIFVQVPSGIAASGNLLSGISSADQITNTTFFTNGTAKSNVTIPSTTNLNDPTSVVFNVGYGMIQVAIGITVGLFFSALIVYPLGKRRSGLFSF